MGKLAIMPLEDYQNLCNNIRELTGTTGPIKSGDMVTKTDEAVDGGAVFDTSDATASSNEILSGETAYADGEKITGTMPNNGTVTQTLNTSTTSYTIPKGYHSGSGKVSITTETKTATPTKSSQSITPTSGKVLSKVDVAAIPSNYITTTDATAAAGEIFEGETAYVNGSKVTGTFTITDELEEQNDLISQISTLLDTKAVPTGGEDVTDETNAYTQKLATLGNAITALETELQGKASGGSSNGVEVEVITITETNTSQIPFTLKRVTKTIGSYNGDSATGLPSVGSTVISSHINTYKFAYSGSPVGVYVNKSEALTLNSGELVVSQYTFAVPYVAVFINDPTQPAIYEE